MPRAGLMKVRDALSLSHWPLRWRISWFLTLMALAIVSAFGLLAYRSARTTTLAATHARLRSALAQINTISELGVVNQLETLRASARDPEVIAAFQQSTGPIDGQALAALKKVQAVPTSVVELVGSDSLIRYSSDPGFSASAKRPAIDFPVEGAIGPIYDSDNAQMFDAGAAVLVEGRKLGTVRLTRRLGRGANRRIIAGLLGEDAALLIGNRDGTVWGEAGAQRYPRGQTPITYWRDGRSWVSVSTEVRGTPWLYAVELPERVAVAPARALLMPFLVTGAAIAVGAALVGLLAGRRVTSPLADLTRAAEAMARGDRSVAITPTGRRDEVGRLANAFVTMAASMHAVQDRLESEIDARSGELGDAVNRLRLLDDELRRNERFAMLGRMSGSVGHELRNPLGVMSTVVFLLDSLPDASPKLKHYSGLLREQIRLSERIISDLLDRARSGSSVLTVVTLHRFIDDLLLRADIPLAITVERHVPSELPDVLFDRDRVGQVLWNLVTNAVQAMNGVGVLTLAVTICGDQLLFEVCDSGPGVSATDHERIFEPLYTTKPAGVGLGLSISRAYARSIGGDLFVKDAVTCGACFVLVLPARLATEAPQASHLGDSLRESAAHGETSWNRPVS